MVDAYSNRQHLEGLDANQVERIDRICDQFAAALQAGESPQLDTFLSQAESDIRHPLLIELISDEVAFLKDKGEAVDLNEYVARFPQDVAAVRKAFGQDDTQPPTEAFAPRLQPGDTILGGRFTIRGVLGQGGFAVVYLADDEQLGRQVAIKSPKEAFKSPKELEEFLSDATIAAKLEHHNGIVQVHDAVSLDDSVFIIQQYIDGESLSERISRSRMANEEVVSTMKATAEAVGFLHTKGFIHRDLKPANILLDSNGRVFVADFGLTVHEDDQLRRRGELAGTFPYMSPEQVRGEVHRMDARSDIWSLGVILYQLLTGRRPFTGKTKTEVYEDILGRDPWFPQQRDPSINFELSRICMRCLEKRASDRYQSTAELIADIIEWKTDHTVPLDDEGIEPKGLRCFTKRDSNHFLKLLPGPYENGIPRSIRFWKSRIEEADPDQSVKVGIMYGPSGCGKSSFIRAGLIPRLDDEIVTLLIEATASETETRILKAIRKECPNVAIADEASLPEVLSTLRKSGGYSGRKVLLVVDQFEQWLHRNPNVEKCQLIEALRFCDGSALQCIVLIRDDFWMSATRFMDALELPMSEGENSGAVDLFDALHAAEVLRRFGLAYGRIANSTPREQTSFLKSAIEMLASDGRIPCIRLSLFAEMMRHQPWEIERLEDLGGAQGLGVTFLEEQFGAVPERRLHRQAAMHVLEALLPLTGSDIRGEMKSYSDLMEASGYQSDPTRFKALLVILDEKLKLITPTETQRDIDEQENAPNQLFFQLTHDFLVPSLRAWLDRTRSRTRRGRAEKKLAELASLWIQKRETRFFPSLWDYARIRLLTDSRRWDRKHSEFMTTARKYLVRRLAIVSSAAALLLVLLFAVITKIQTDEREARLRTAVASVSTSSGQFVAPAIEHLREFTSEDVIPLLKSSLANVRKSDRLPLALALASFGEVDCQILLSDLMNRSPTEVDNIVRALRYDRKCTASIMAIASKSEKTGDWRKKSRLAQIAFLLGEPSIAEEMCRLATDPSQRSIFVSESIMWHGDLGTWADLASRIESNDLKSALAIIIGEIAPKHEDRGSWVSVLEGWFKFERGAGLHSTAGWALERLERRLPAITKSRIPLDGFHWHVSTSGITMILIDEGSFQRDVGSFEQTVKLSQFLISDREVTVSQFEEFMIDTSIDSREKPIGWQGIFKPISPTGQHPAQNISWADALLYCNWLSKKEGLTPVYFRNENNVWCMDVTKNGYRLPTEAEWEYAARCRSQTQYFFGDDPARMSMYGTIRTTEASKCGSKAPNGFGLFDVHGNVWEWCWDLKGDLPPEEYLEDPTGATSGDGHVSRGGSCTGTAGDCSFSRRGKGLRNQRHVNIGFRVVKRP